MAVLRRRMPPYQACILDSDARPAPVELAAQERRAGARRTNGEETAKRAPLRSTEMGPRLIQTNTSRN